MNIRWNNTLAYSRKLKKEITKSKNDLWENRCRLVEENILETNRKKETAPINLIVHSQWRKYDQTLLNKDIAEFFVDTDN